MSSYRVPSKAVSMVEFSCYVSPNAYITQVLDSINQVKYKNDFNHV